MHPIRIPAFAALVAALACGDPNELPDPQNENVVDTVTISALTGTPIRLPSAYSISDRAPVRTDLSAQFDFAFDMIPPANTAALLPRAALGFPADGAQQPGLQQSDDAFAEIREALLNGYVTSDTIPVAVGERYLARSRVICSSLGVPLYAKLEVLAIDAVARTVTFQVLVDENCGYIGLEPGLPEN